MRHRLKRERIAEAKASTECPECLLPVPCGQHTGSCAHRKEMGAKSPRPHRCQDHPVYYEFWEDGRRYHGYDCGVCGVLLQTG